MATEFKLPELGEGIESGDIIDVLVSEGDDIRADQDVVEIETEKAVVPVPCPFAGKVTKINVKRGDSVPVGGLLLSVETADQGAEQPAGGKEPSADNGKEQAQQPAESAAKPAESKPAENKRAAQSEERQSAAAERHEMSDGKAKPERIARQETGVEQPIAASEQRPPSQAITPRIAGTSRQEPPPPASPDTRRYARELGVDLHQVTGTGPGGRISKDDVKAAVRNRLSGISSAPALAPRTTPEGEPDRDAWGPIRRAPLSKIRQTIARKMAQSAATIPHVTNFDDADITELERIRKGSMAEYVGDVKLTMMAFVMKAAALSLRQHPDINASFDEENNELIYKQYVNIGVAVDTPRGLVVPVMREVDRLTIPQIAQRLTQMAHSVRDGRFQMDDVRGGTFTISNLGAIGGTYSTPIINHPEVAILLLGRSRRLPVVVDEAVGIRLMMPLSLSYDHRLVDGATAARFLNEIKNYLEVPGRLLLAP